MYNNPLQEALEQLNNIKGSSTQNLQEDFLSVRNKLEKNKDWKNTLNYKEWDTIIMYGLSGFGIEGIKGSDREFEQCYDDNKKLYKEALSKLKGHQVSVIYKWLNAPFTLICDISDITEQQDFAISRFIFTPKKLIPNPSASDVDFSEVSEEIDLNFLLDHGYLRKSLWGMIPTDFCLLDKDPTMEQLISALQDTNTILKNIQSNMDRRKYFVKTPTQISWDYNIK